MLEDARQIGPLSQEEAEKRLGPTSSTYLYFDLLPTCVQLYDPETPDLPGANWFWLRCRTARAFPSGLQHRRQRRQVRLRTRLLLFFRRLARRNAARRDDPFPQFHTRLLARSFDHAPGHDVSLMPLRNVFLNARRQELFHAQLEPPFFRVEFEHLRFHSLSNLQHVRRMVHALLRAHVADVN